MKFSGRGRDRVTLDLSGQEVVSHLCQGTVVLTMTGGYVVVLEAPFTVATPGGSRRVDPARAAESTSLAEELVGQTIVSSAIDDAGSLSVTFTSGIRLLAEPDDGFDAWTVTGPAGMLVVCTSGGKLAVWRGAGRRPTPHPIRSEQPKGQDGPS